jgi:hypothetical protein
MEKQDVYTKFLNELSEKFLITDKGIYEIENDKISINIKLKKWCETNNKLKQTNLNSYNNKKIAGNIVSTITTIKAREYISPIDKNLIYSFGDFGLSLIVSVNGNEIFETTSIVDDFESGTFEENKKLIEDYINNLENNYVNLIMYLQEIMNNIPEEISNENLEKLKFRDPIDLDNLNINNRKERDMPKLIPAQRSQRTRRQAGGDLV